MRVLKIRLYKIIVCSCMIYDFFSQHRWNYLCIFDHKSWFMATSRWSLLCIRPKFDTSLAVQLHHSHIISSTTSNCYSIICTTITILLCKSCNDLESFLSISKTNFIVTLRTSVLYSLFEISSSIWNFKLNSKISN